MLRIDKYRLALFFVLTAVLAIGIAVIVVNHVIGNLATDNLVEIAEDSSLREAVHVEAMIMGQNHVGVGDTMGPETSEALGMLSTMSPPRTLQGVVASQEILSMMPSLARGLNIAKISLLYPEGGVAWSTAPEDIGSDHAAPKRVALAVEGHVSSEFTHGKEVVDLAGKRRPIDVVETLLPLTEPNSGQSIGVISIERDVSGDVSIQVDDTQAAVLWTTMGTMGGLFLILIGFIVVADVTINRSRQRELFVVEEANRGLEERVVERTKELQQANQQLIEAQEQLVRKEKLAAIGQLAGGVAHDLRNPLGAIKNAVYYLRTKLRTTDLALSNPRIPQFMQIVDEEVDRSNQILTDLMSLARTAPLNLSPTDLGVLIDDISSSVKMGPVTRLAKQMALDLPRVLVDVEQLRRVFTNLAANASDAMPDGGLLTITSRKENGLVEVDFQDTGTGIEENELTKVFEPLFTTKAMGTGLGLAICQEIVSKHGGIIGVTSVKGVGSTFTVIMPVNGLDGQKEG